MGEKKRGSDNDCDTRHEEILSSILDNTSVAVAAHRYHAGGLDDQLVSFLNSLKVKSLVQIIHPFPFAPELATQVRIYQAGVLKRRLRGPSPFGPELVFYLKDFVFNLYYFLFSTSPVDIFIGFDNLNATGGIMLKKMKRVKRVIYYALDYVPRRFSNNLLNSLYHRMDRYCCSHSDVLWAATSAIFEGKKRSWPHLRFAPSVEVPTGYNDQSLKPLPLAMINRHALIFLGHLIERTGLSLVLNALPELSRRIPDLTLLVIGGGESLDYFRDLTRKLNLQGRVRYTGLLEDHHQVEELTRTCAVGLAPYPPEVKGEESFSVYADPGKAKLYLGAGLPVIIGNVPPFARTIDQARAGFSVAHNEEEFISKTYRLLTDDALYRQYRRNAIALGKRYAWRKIFGNALCSSFPHFPELNIPADA